MEPPPPAAPPLSSTGAAAAGHPNNYPDSVESSPRSRNADSWDEPQFPSLPGAGPKLRLMCSYGGHIVPRPHDKSLCYVGGDTRIVLSERYSSLSDLTHRLSKTLLHGKPFVLRYQLPNEDLDSLISVTTDEDLDNMIEEYDRINSNAAVKSSRLRLFLFPSKPESMGSLLEDSTKSEDWFVNALNGSSSRGFSESASVNCLLGLDDDDVLGNSNSASAAAGKDGVKGGGGVSVHSVPDSPMLETSSSFGSTSSSPSLANLPPIRVHVADEQKGGGIEEQFAHLNVVAGAPPPVSSPPTTAVLTTLAAAAGLSGEYSNRVFPDDDRSGEGMGFGYRKLPQPSQLQTKPTGGLELASPDSVSSDNSITNPLSRQRPLIYQEPVVQTAFPVDPKLSDPNSRVLLQQVQDSGYLLPNQFDQHHQQLNQQQQQQLNQQHHHQQQLNQQQQQQSKQRHDQQQQFNQQHDQQQQLNQQQQQQLNQHHHQQQQFNQQHDQQQHLNQQQQQLNEHHQQQQNLNQQQQQLNQQQHQQQQLNQQQQQLNQHQFRHAGTHYIQQHPSGQAPIPPYYQIYPPQQQPLHPLDQQYHQPMYYMPSRQAQPYNFVVQQPNYNEAATTASSRLQTAPLPSSVMPMPPPPSYTTARNPPAASKPEMTTGMYRTATQTAPPSAQHQQHYVGFSQIHHASQSAAPNSGNTGTYAYEFVDPNQMYYPQPMAPQLAAQYQTMTSGPAMVLPEASTQLPTDSTKQQSRTSQP